MAESFEMDKIKQYFADKLNEHGATPLGADYNSAVSQEARFHQLIKEINTSVRYSLLDFGSGYGSMYDYLIRLGHDVHYVGYDISVLMLAKGREIHPDNHPASTLPEITLPLIIPSTPQAQAEWK